MILQSVNWILKRYKMELKELKVLYADDEIEIRNMVKDCLKSRVKEFYTAKDGLEAFSIYKEKKPDIILLDIHMPNSDGIEVAKKIRQNDHSTRIIMITAFSDTKNLLAASELKLTKYIVKPFSINDVLNSLELALQETLNFKTTNKKNIYLADDFVWDVEVESLFKGSCEVGLTPKERKILQILFSNVNATVSYDTLLIEVWDDFENHSIDTLKTMMKNIRRKLPTNTISNIYATGYKIIL